MKQLKMSDTVVSMGGLMRCCIKSLSEYIDEHADEPAVSGTTVPCKYENNADRTMILEGKVWYWNKGLDDEL